MSVYSMDEKSRKMVQCSGKLHYFTSRDTLRVFRNSELVEIRAYLMTSTPECNSMFLCLYDTPLTEDTRQMVLQTCLANASMYYNGLRYIFEYPCASKTQPVPMRHLPTVFETLRIQVKDYRYFFREANEIDTMADDESGEREDAVSALSEMVKKLPKFVSPEYFDQRFSDSRGHPLNDKTQNEQTKSTDKSGKVKTMPAASEKYKQECRRFIVENPNFISFCCLILFRAAAGEHEKVVQALETSHDLYNETNGSNISPLPHGFKLFLRSLIPFCSSDVGARSLLIKTGRLENFAIRYTHVQHLAYKGQLAANLFVEVLRRYTMSAEELTKILICRAVGNDLKNVLWFLREHMGNSAADMFPYAYYFVGERFNMLTIENAPNLIYVLRVILGQNGGGEKGIMSSVDSETPELDTETKSLLTKIGRNALKLLKNNRDERYLGTAMVECIKDLSISESVGKEEEGESLVKPKNLENATSEPMAQKYQAQE